MRDILLYKIDELKKNEILLLFSETIGMICPHENNTYTLSENELILRKFCRYSLRTNYFIRKFYEEYLNILDNPLIKDAKCNLRIRVDNDIYYISDAAIISFKSITEKDFYKNSSFKDIVIQEKFTEKSKYWKKTIDEYNLGAIRNDVVHVNDFGLSLVSWIKKKEFGYELLFTDWQEVPITQEKLITIYESAIEFIMDFLGIYVSDIFKLYGRPVKDEYYYGDISNRICLKDYRLIL